MADRQDGDGVIEGVKWQLHAQPHAQPHALDDTPQHVPMI